MSATGGSQLCVSYVLLAVLAGDLKRLIRRMAEAGRSFDEPEIWLYFSQILDGLRGMHASRILHRDIKPANVLVSGTLQKHCRGLLAAPVDEGQQ
jgi:serine/threonine protein kinase